MTHQGALTIITEIKPERVEALKKLLAEIADDVEENPHVPFLRIKTIHFARWVVLDEAEDMKGDKIAPTLAFSTNYDEPLDAHLSEMVEVAGEGLAEIYSHCVGFTSGDDLAAYLKRHRRGYGAFHNASPGRSVVQIQAEAKLRQAIETYLDEDKPQDDGRSIRQAIRNFVAGRGDLKWALTPSPPATLGWKIRHYGKLALILLLLLIFLPAAVVGVGILLLLIRLREIREEETPNTTFDRRASELARQEDHLVQNQLSNIVAIKPGFLRHATLRIVFAALEVLARYIFTKGKLGSIPSIHFARWVIVDDARRLLFFSNFDGSWENYLGDFIDKAAVGLTAVWSNTHLYPKTKWLLFEGARDEQRFKAWARDIQLFTQVWYSAYPELSTVNINDNSKIRAGLSGTMSEAEALAWLRLF